MIRYPTSDDAVQVCEIYNHYVLKTTITFEEEPVSPEEMAERMPDSIRSMPWLVWEEHGTLLGFCYATQWKARSAYRHSAESSVYVRSTTTGIGIGTRLYDALFQELRQRQMHSVIAVISLPNHASVVFHERLGFEKAAHFKEVGLKFDDWIDVGCWQLLL